MQQEVIETSIVLIEVPMKNETYPVGQEQDQTSILPVALWITSQPMV
jgi:hypothetical protein